MNQKEYKKNYYLEHTVPKSLILHKGCCVICFETNPFKLESHHVFGKENSDLTICLCANHHGLL